MKKAKYFFATFLPALIAISFQFLSIFFLLGITTLVRLTSGKQVFFSDLQTLLGNINFSMTLSIMFALLNIAFFGLWYYYKYEGSYRLTGRGNSRSVFFIALLLLSPSCYAGAGFIANGISLLLPHSLETYSDLIEKSGLTDTLNPLMLIYAVILGPIGEELIFRGVTLRSARRIFPFWAANLMQAVLFGIFHMNVIQGTYAFAFGLLLGIVCEKLGSIYYSIFLHICFNFYGTVISLFLSSINPASPFWLLYFPFLLATVIISIVLFRHGIRNQREGNRNG